MLFFRITTFLLDLNSVLHTSRELLVLVLSFCFFHTGSGAFPARSQRSGLDRYSALLVFSSYDIESLCSSLHSPAAFS